MYRRYAGIWPAMITPFRNGNVDHAALKKLMPPPYYVRPSQRGIRDFYTAVADNTSVPLILYNIPYRAGISIELHTFRELAKHPMIQGDKDCGGDLALTMQLISDGELDVLAGEDMNIFTTLCLGGSGAIAAASHVRPDLFVQMARLIQTERLDKARTLCHALTPMVHDLFSEPNPAPIKALLADTGLIENELRIPMTRASETLARTLLNHLRNLKDPLNNEGF